MTNCVPKRPIIPGNISKYGTQKPCWALRADDQMRSYSQLFWYTVYRKSPLVDHSQGPRTVQTVLFCYCQIVSPPFEHFQPKNGASEWFALYLQPIRGLCWACRVWIWVELSLGLRHLRSTGSQYQFLYRSWCQLAMALNGNLDDLGFLDGKWL